MPWADAQTNLVSALETLGADVHLTPPPMLPDNDIHVIVVPPAREVNRRPNMRRTNYSQTITVVALLPDNVPDANDVGRRIDAFVERINSVLDGELTLDEDATHVSPPVWEEFAVIEWTQGSGVLAGSMTGSIGIELQLPATFSA